MKDKQVRSKLPVEKIERERLNNIIINNKSERREANGRSLRREWLNSETTNSVSCRTMEDDDDGAAGGATTHQVKLHAYKIESGIPIKFYALHPRPEIILIFMLLCVETDSNIRDLWLSGIVVHGREYIYSQAGIESFRPVSVIVSMPYFFLSHLICL